MKNPLQIDYLHLQATPAIEAAIREQVAKLERFHPDLLGCRVSIDAAGRHPRKGAGYRIHVTLQVPGGPLAISADDGREDVDFYAALRHAFGTARRQLEDDARIRRGDVKHHDHRLPGVEA